MSALLSLLPPRVIVAAFAFGTEPEWLPERSRETVRAVLRSFGTAIAEDPNLELIVMPMDQSLPQLHLANGKVLVMTAPSSSLASFRAALAALRMPEVQNLATIDEFPRAIGYPLGATAKLVGELRQTIQSIAYLTRTQDPLSERKRSGALLRNDRFGNCRLTNAQKSSPLSVRCQIRWNCETLSSCAAILVRRLVARVRCARFASMEPR